jgi:hypothetical protein
MRMTIPRGSLLLTVATARYVAVFLYDGGNEFIAGKRSAQKSTGDSSRP